MKPITTSQDQPYSESEELQRQLNELPENDPQRDILYEEYTEAALSEYEDLFGISYAKELRKIMK